MSGSNLLFVLTGSIAAYKACDALSQLVKRGHRVRTVATEAALHFVGPATLEGLTGAPVLSGMFAPGTALDHIELTRWADAVVVCPATANTLNRFAAGLADDLPGALFLAHDRRKPWLVAPAMNPAMWAHPATAAAVERLRAWGVRFIGPAEGRTACGEEGEGRMVEAGAVVDAVEAALRPAPARRLRVLVTAGGTAEPVDGVRVLTNTSTGTTGAGIAAHLARRGHDVTLLRAKNAARPATPCREEVFGSYAELDDALGQLLGAEPFDAVIHAAAVSDYGVELVLASGGVQPAGVVKLDSAASPLLRLRPHPKLVDSLRARSRGPLRVVAFKLTRGADEAEAAAAVRRLLGHSGADLVVHNDLAARSDGEHFPSVLHGPDGTVLARCATRTGLASALEQWLVNPATPVQPLAHAPLP